MSRRIILGQSFGRLIVKAEAAVSASGKARSLCVCLCGNEKIIDNNNLKNCRSSSCGCLRSEQLVARSRTHGKRSTTEYNIWSKMRIRCSDPTNKHFKNYGGRGISVCEDPRGRFHNSK